MKHCRDNSEGKARLEIWFVIPYYVHRVATLNLSRAIQAYGEVEGRKKLAARRMPPGRKLIGRDALFCQRAGLGGLVHLVINKASVSVVCLSYIFVALLFRRDRSNSVNIKAQLL